MRVSSLFEVVGTKRLERVSSDFADSTAIENIANLANVLQIPNSDSDGHILLRICTFKGKPKNFFTHWWYLEQ